MAKPVRRWVVVFSSTSRASVGIQKTGGWWWFRGRVPSEDLYPEGGG